VSERTGGKIDARDSVLRVNAESRSIAAIGLQLVRSEPSLEKECRVERQSRMTLRQDEPIALRGARVGDPENS
jgi:hypothetical protein